jgi:ubiquinone/menaquinone biosynthesis C-methylase UbiE/uncharacterized protein YbaR (Trm112 family)
MKRSSLELLRCPACRSSLSMWDEGDSDSVDAGELACAGCGRSFAIRDGIPRFIEAGELEGPDRRFAGFYDRFSRLYPCFTKLMFLGMGGDRRARKEVLDRLELAGGRVLEVSVGTGANLSYLFESPDVREVYGLDISAGQLARCREVVTKRGWPVDLFLGTAEALPFQDEAFDSVLHIGGINFFTHKQEAIGEMIRVARPGGKIVIADETERLARLICHFPGLGPSRSDTKPDLAVPVHLVPDTMEEIRVDGVWKAHGRPHGYCLEFRKPA